MTILVDFSKLQALPVAERLRLIEQLCDSISPADAAPLQDWQREELELRLDALASGTSVGSPWSQVRERV
jgi:putative addiction module component (TIGR02574 family)